MERFHIFFVLCKATLKEEKNSFLFWSLGGPKINECEDGKREVSNPWFCMVDKGPFNN